MTTELAKKIAARIERTPCRGAKWCRFDHGLAHAADAFVEVKYDDLIGASTRPRLSDETLRAVIDFVMHTGLWTDEQHAEFAAWMAAQ